MKSVVNAFLLLGLAALFFSCGDPDPQARVKDLLDDECRELASDEQYAECLQKLDELSASAPDDSWAVCSRAAVMSSQYLERYSRMVSVYAVRPSSPDACGLYKWTSDRRPAVLKSLQACSELGGPAWMGEDGYQDLKSAVGGALPFADIERRCSKAKP